MTSEGSKLVEVEVLFMVTGRVPNIDFLDPSVSGIEVDAHGHVISNDTCQRSVPGI